jgi:hypothetical protein
MRHARVEVWKILTALVGFTLLGLLGVAAKP